MCINRASPNRAYLATVLLIPSFLNFINPLSVAHLLKIERPTHNLKTGLLADFIKTFINHRLLS